MSLFPRRILWKFLRVAMFSKAKHFKDVWRLIGISRERGLEKLPRGGDMDNLRSYTLKSTQKKSYFISEKTLLNHIITNRVQIIQNDIWNKLGWKMLAHRNKHDILVSEFISITKLEYILKNPVGHIDGHKCNHIGWKLAFYCQNLLLALLKKHRPQTRPRKRTAGNIQHYARALEKSTKDNQDFTMSISSRLQLDMPRNTLKITQICVLFRV